jgi:MoaA/NifB/PqqE/SkfB family radical SAM enzyme
VDTAGANAIVALDHADPGHAENTLVDWMLGNRCPYACSYCPAELHDGGLAWISGDAAVGFLASLRRHYIDGLKRRLWLQYTGGEPTAHPEFPRILAAGKRSGFGQALISNAARSPRYWSRIIGDIDFVILTFHVEFAEFDHFVRVAKIIAAARPLQINVAMLPARFEECRSVAERLRGQLPAADIVMKPLRKNFGVELFDYAPGELETMSGGAQERFEFGAPTPRSTMRQRRADGGMESVRANWLILNDMNRWRSWRCMAGIESLRIAANGDIFRSVCGVGGRIGRIGGEVNFPTVGVTCDRERCACVSDILISKRRRSAEQPAIAA